MAVPYHVEVCSYPTHRRIRAVGSLLLEQGPVAGRLRDRGRGKVVRVVGGLDLAGVVEVDYAGPDVVLLARYVHQLGRWPILHIPPCVIQA